MIKRLFLILIVLIVALQPGAARAAQPASPAESAPAAPTPRPTWSQRGDQANAVFGNSVSDAGDVNGDGYGDVVVGAYGYTNGELYEGRAYLYLGSAAGLSATPAWTAESDQANTEFGRSVSDAGDVNGDGFGDVIVGAVFYDTYPEYDAGRAYLYLGSVGGLSATPAWTAEGDQANALFGISVSDAGDVNGDGYGDVIVGALYPGNAYLYLGSAAGLSATPAWTVDSDQAAAFGVSVSDAGDVNGDGYGDVIVGASSYGNGENYEGRSYLYLGSSAGLSATPAWTAESNQANAAFGRSVSDAGDVNTDGYGDVIVGAPFNTNGETYEGRSYLYLGSAAGLSATPAWTAESDQAGAGFGHSVSDAGDVNGDGYGDVIVGANGYDNGEVDEGRVYLYLGSAAGLRLANRTFETNYAVALFGSFVSSAGDVNGDGLGDFIVGAPEAPKQLRGAAFVWHGR